MDVFQLFLDAEAHFDHMGELRAQALVVAIKIIEDTGGDKLMESDTGHHLADLLQGAKAAGKGDEGIAQLDHFGAALWKIAGDIKVGQPLVLEVLLHEEGDLHAGDFPAGLQGAFRQSAHQAGPGAAVDEGMATFTDPAAKGADDGIQLWIITGGGAEINGDIHGVDPFVGFYFSKGEGPNKLRILAAN